MNSTRKFVIIAAIVIMLGQTPGSAIAASFKNRNDFTTKSFLSSNSIIESVVKRQAANVTSLNWVSNGPEGGQVNSLVQSTESPSTLLAGTLLGLYKSSDYGKHWVAQHITTNDTAISRLAVSLSSPGIIYASISNMIMKSIDFGTTWVFAGSLANNIYWNFDLVVDPLSSSIVYSGTNAGIYKSIDSGKSWSLSSTGLPANPNVYSIVVDPRQNTIIIIGTYYGIYKSIDSGLSWNQLSSATGRTKTLVMHPTNSNILYAGASGKGVMSSVDGGLTWQTSKNGWNFNTDIDGLTFDVNNPNTLYAKMPYGMAMTQDGGQTWVNFKNGLPAEGTYSYTDGKAELLSLSNGDVISGGRPGIFRAEAGDTQWRRSNSGMVNTNVRDITIDPNSPNTVYAATDAQGIYKSIDSGLSWTEISNGLTTNDVYCLKMDPTNSQIIYAGTWSSGMYKTTNGGQNWTPMNNGLTNQPIVDLEILASNPSRIYAATWQGLYISQNGGANWSLSSTGFNPTMLNVVAVNPANPAVIVLGARPDLWKSTDGGANWTKVYSAYVFESLAFDPINPSIIYAGDFQNLLLKSIDGGDTWSILPQNSGEILALYVDSSGTVYMGGSGGINKSTDGGQTWISLNSNPLGKQLAVNTFVIDPTNPERIYGAGMHLGAVIVTDNNPPKDWTLMFYLAEDNDLNPLITDQYKNLRLASANSATNIIAFSDLPQTEAKYMAYNPTGPTTTLMGELSTGNPDTLRDFVLWTKKNYPANHYALIIVDHGHGHTGVAMDNDSHGDLKDCNGQACLTLTDLKTALNSVGKIDIINMVACTMGTIEAAYQLRGITDYYVSSQQLIWVLMRPDWWSLGHTESAYGKQITIPAISYNTPPETLADSMAASYYAETYNLDSVPYPGTISVARMAYIDDLKIKTSALASLLKAQMSQTHTQMSEIMTSVQRFGGMNISMNDEIVDLYDFADEVETKITNPDIQAAAQQVKVAVQAYVPSSNSYAFQWSGNFMYHGNPYSWDVARGHGVSIFFPNYSRSFYKSSWLDFAAGTVWNINDIGNASNSFVEITDTNDWGPMIVEYVRQTNPSIPDNPNPPELLAPLMTIQSVFLPAIRR